MLDIGNNDLGDQAVINIKNSHNDRLWDLKLNDTNIHDEAGLALIGYSRLEFLDVRNNHIGPAVIKKLRAAFSGRVETDGNDGK